MAECLQQFPFPFPAYDIQKRFMQNLYNIIENEHIGIMESPTGTGKTMSIICGACKWLEDDQLRRRQRMQTKCNELKKQQQQLEVSNNTSSSSTANADDDWLSSDYEKLKRGDELRQTERGLKRLNSFDRRKAEIKHRAKVEWLRTEEEKRSAAINAASRNPTTNSGKKKRAKPDEGKSSNNVAETKDDDDDDENDASFLPEVACSEKTDKKLKNLDTLHDENNNNKYDDDSEDDENLDSKPTKIFYCCRTHSQLSQFIHQFQQSPYATKFFAIPLASRQQLCINPAVNSLKSQGAMNDRCLELKDKSACEFYSKRIMHVKKLADRALAEPADVEQLFAAGIKGHACPYYATRYAAQSRQAEIIVLPYNSIFHPATREALGLDDLRGHVVIVDEAHNFSDAVANVNSAQLDSRQLANCAAQLDMYMQKYRDRLNAKNLLYVKQVRRIVGEVLKIVTVPAGKLASSSSFSLTLTEFKQRASSFAHLNVCELLEFLQSSRLSRKLNGFARIMTAKARKEQQLTDEKVSVSAAKRVKLSSEIKSTPAAAAFAGGGGSALIQVEAFLKLLFDMSCNLALHDTIRIIVETSANRHNSDAVAGADDAVPSTVADTTTTTTIRVVILNVAEHVRDLLHQARAVIFAGGTMQPIDELREHILMRAGIPAERIEFHSYGHVVPQRNVLVLALGHGPLVAPASSSSSSPGMLFTYERRLKPEVMRQLALTLLETIKIVPHGVVCFFPSYSYEEKFYQFLSSHGSTDNKTAATKEKSFLAEISTHKLVLREPRASRGVDAILHQFQTTIAAARLGHAQLTGAMMFAVVGGKLSEGINFADELCRCVVMIGLPYPNRIANVELREKLAFLDRSSTVTTTTRSNNSKRGGVLPSAAHYEALCMKAINQSIGRAIRHRNDYAVMLLLDERFCNKNADTNVLLNGLPKWLLPSLVNCDGAAGGGFQRAIREMRNFFAANHEKV